MAACVLTLFVVTPVVGMAGCFCDEAAYATSAASEQTIAVDQGEDSAPCKAACCVGGHCHSANPTVDAPISLVLAPIPVAAQHPLPASRLLTSRGSSTIERPPRG